MNTICIDARMWGIKDTGIGRYVENLISNLPKQDRTKVIVIIHPSLKDEPALQQFTKAYAHFHPYSILAQSEMFFLLWRLKPDLTHFTQFSIPIFWWGKFIVTIHDLIKHFSVGRQTTTRNPAIYWLKYLGYHVVMFLAVMRATKIIVPANYWKDLLVKIYRISPSKIEVTYEGANSVFLHAKPSKPHTFITHPYVIYTGNLYPHKNVDVLIKAIDHINHRRLLSKPLHLAVVCARSVFESRLPPSPWVKYLGRVSDAELVSLYQHASCFVFPSRIEGFGLPGIEAMSVGTPVIAAAASCLPEVYSSAALYFEPSNHLDLADKIIMLLTNDQLRRQLVFAGTKQARKYSWSKMAKETWEIYHSVLH